MTPNDRAFPPLYLIADMEAADRLEVDLPEVVDDFVRAGGRMVSLRPGGADDRRLLKLGEAMSESVAGADGWFFVHRRVDLAVLLGADGVHAPSRGMTVGEMKKIAGRRLVCGRSSHDRDELERAVEAGADFATLGPLFESISKPGYGPELHAASFRELADGVEIPVYALGGVVPGNVEACLEAGADGVGVVGAVLGAESPYEATRRFLDVIGQ